MDHCIRRKWVMVGFMFERGCPLPGFEQLDFIGHSELARDFA